MQWNDYTQTSTGQILMKLIEGWDGFITKGIIWLTLTGMVTGCGSFFNSAVKSLPSVQDCQHVLYERTGNVVTIKADCQVPLQDSSLLSLPVKP